MRKKIVSITARFFIFGLIVFSFLIQPDLGAQASSPLPKLGQVQVKGSVNVSDRPAGDALSVNIRLFLKGKKMTGQKVKVNNAVIPEAKPGYYFKFVKPYQAGSGKKVWIDISPPLHIYGSEHSIHGTVITGVTARIVAPVPGTSIRLSQIRKIDIRWMPFVNNATLDVFEMKGKTAGDHAYTATVSGGGTQIDAHLLKPGKRYGIYLRYNMGIFKLSGGQAGNSKLHLSYSTATYIKTN